MSFQSQPFYTVACDACGTTLSETRDDENGYWYSEDEAHEEAIDDDWTFDGKKHHCPSCPGLAVCDRCSKPVRQSKALDDRDGLCKACYEKERDQLIKHSRAHQEALYEASKQPTFYETLGEIEDVLKETGSYEAPVDQGPKATVISE